MEKILVSACLIGERVRYDGREAGLHEPLFLRWQREGRLVPLCPEVAGGLPVPRPPAERRGDRVVTLGGDDVTSHFDRGARAALKLAQREGIRIAVLKERSPSCGSRFVYEDGALVEGQGRTAELLRAHGIQVFSDEELDAAREALERLEAGR